MSKQGRIRTQEMRKAQEEAARKAEQRRRILSIVGVLAIVGLIVAIAIVVVRATGDSEDPAPTGPLVEPANLNADGGIPVGQDDAPVTVTLYFDYMCPACGAFEETNGDDLDGLIEEGAVAMDLRPISFLDRTSNGTRYSSRSANAFVTTADADPDHAWAFHQALYASQPEEGTDGLSDDEIADIATSAGVPADVVETFTDGTFEPWVAQTTETAFETIDGTPTVLIDGEPFEDWQTPGALADAIESAAGA